MTRAELFRVSNPSTRDPKKFRIFVIVSRQVLIDSRFSTVICAPVYTAYDGLATQVLVGPDDGFKHECSIHCDELVSLPKSFLTNYVGMLSQSKLGELNNSLQIALGLSA
ncbi:MAG TPA: type II toxin-antitoxin system PemK/MazF family toxin [Candidatus Hydrogenedentes bacterium]|nr:type II toxin-antitoxin system PemK/MazF family toxin [Candidatus Hydrogenedentota bacterium]HRK36100.1 type II toxin-antitoxin system PemK/MazF family toxin [Candidatus Hydrogenedentota bacterium]